MRGRDMTLRHDERTHKQQRFFFCCQKKTFRKFFFKGQCSELCSTREMRSIGRRHRVRLAKGGRWIWLDGQKVSKMSRNEQ